MILGERLFRALMRATFYGQFVVGEDTQQIRPKLDHMESFGVRAMLNYTAEQDLSTGHKSLAEIESACEHCVQTFFQCLDAVASRPGYQGFASMKITAHTLPHILTQISDAWCKCPTDQIEHVLPRALRTREDMEMYDNLMSRMRQMAQYGKERGARVMVDAEQTYFQPAIDLITIELMREFNREKATIFNTYQCYLKVEE